MARRTPGISRREFKAASEQTLLQMPSAPVPWQGRSLRVSVFPVAAVLRDTALCNQWLLPPE